MSKPKGKSAVSWAVLVFGLFLVGAAVWFYVQSTADDPGGDDILSGRITFEDAADDTENPDIMIVTEGDKLFHRRDCSWIGSERRRMSRAKAEAAGYKPCPQCIGEE